MSAFGYSGSTVYRRRVALGVAVGREWVLGAAVEREWALGAAVEREWALGAAVEREWALVAAVADGMALGVGVADGLATAVAVEWFGLVEDDRAVGVGWSAPSAPDVSEIDMRTDRTRSP